MFITALTSVRHLYLSWANPIQSIYPHPTSWRSILILSTHLRLIYIYIYTQNISSDDGLQICPKHVEVDWWNKLRINSASSGFSLQRNIAHYLCHAAATYYEIYTFMSWGMCWAILPTVCFKLIFTSKEQISAFSTIPLYAKLRRSNINICT